MKHTENWLRQEGHLKRVSKALVTGAASGLGQETAKALHQAGIEVWASDLNVEALKPLADLGIHCVSLDVTSEASIQHALAKVYQQTDYIDLLVNIAGLAKPGALEAQDFKEVALQFEVNSFGPLRLTQALGPKMREQGYGRIITVSSTNGFIVTPFMGAYSASKYAIEALSDSLRLEYKPFGVEVILIEPGAMKTPFADRAQAALEASIAKAPQAWQDYLRAFMKSPLWGTGNASNPAKVAKVIVKAALAKKAKARIIATPDAYGSRFVSMLPAAIKDKIFISMAKLKPKGHQA
ncbi:MAG: SDR family oxidoreductase [Deinococcales bacterium]